ncbi:hypothetical protein FIBSPDRAFT_231346 [Athelia psychrophila]|uniref:Uncharacterized protein n=1 Tax=Athelia psychrophila TaxID=1759441 RepID=A0A165YLJ4_9AGAM|nr:hypothetical protein FIBSPDRAFT_231346 [Fibularhizoctonia sp. CBS 109695]
MGQVGCILVPIGLFALACTTYASVRGSSQIPMIASIPGRFGAGIYFALTPHSRVPRHRLPPHRRLRHGRQHLSRNIRSQ